MKKYSKDEILLMTSTQMSAALLDKRVEILKEDGNRVTGIVRTIIRASNCNSEPKDHLPVDLKLDNNSTVNVFQIQEITIIK